MSASAPFRDLFVELPRAVFDALHAWGEAAIVKAQAPVPVAPFRIGPPTALSYPTILSARYGWRQCDSWRVEYECRTTIEAVLNCGHRQRYYVTDHLAANGPHDQIAIIDRVVDNTPRDCCCVQREP